MKKTFSIPETISKMVGRRYNHFTILRINKALSLKKNKPFVIAKCDCGKIVKCNGWHFVYDLRFSCGHVRRKGKKGYWQIGLTGSPKNVERTTPKK